MGFLRILLTLVGVLVGLALLIAVILGVLVDRGRDAGQPTSTSAGNTGSLPAATVTRLEPGTDLQQGRVEWVSDGDTIRVRISGASESVRLIGIDAPEISDTRTDADCYSSEASAYLTELLDGATVWLEPDVNNRDIYDRLLRYVWLRQDDGYLMVNQLLVSHGFAAARQYGQDGKHAALLAETERIAIKTGTGIWSRCITDEQHDTPGAPDGWDGERDLDCPDFSTRVNAQAFYSATGGPTFDPFNLDLDRNGLVCQSRPPTEPL